MTYSFLSMCVCMDNLFDVDPILTHTYIKHQLSNWVLLLNENLIWELKSRAVL